MPQAEDHPHRLVVTRPNGCRMDHPVDDFAGAVRSVERLAPLVPADATWWVEPTRLTGRR